MNLIDAVIIAAGKSRRMGFPKGLATINGQTILDTSMRAYCEFRVDNLHIVFGENFDAYMQAQPGLQNTTHLHTNINVIKNDNYGFGPIYSVYLAAKDSKADWLFVSPIDSLIKNTATLETLVTTCKNHSECKIIKPTFNGRGGHPILVNTRWFMEATASLNFSSLRLDYLIQELPQHKVARVEISDHLVLANLNTIEDLHITEEHLKPN